MEIEEIMKKQMISIMFQPIQDISINQIFGYEALARGPAGRLYSPINLFNAAQKIGQHQQMEVMCIEHALREMHKLPNTPKVFLNISPKTLLYHYKEILKTIRLNNSKEVVLELAEKDLKEKSRIEMAKILDHIRQAGIKIALDDVGSGDRSFSNICELPADFLKIDRSMIKGLTKYKNGSASHYLTALGAMVTIANDLGAKVIAEGVETPKQLEIVKNAGVNLVQGFYFSQPKPVDHWKNAKGVTIC